MIVKRSISDWLGILMTTGIFGLVISAGGIFLNGNGSGFPSFYVVAFMFVVFFGCLIYFRQGKRVDGISLDEIIVETCNSVDVRDIEGSTTEDVIRAQEALEKYKIETGFEFTGDALYDQLIVTFKDDVHREVQVTRVVNTRKYVLEGKVEVLKNSILVSGVAINVSADSSLGPRIRALSGDKEGVYRIEYVRPIVYNKKLAMLDTIDEDDSEENKKKKRISDVVISVKKIN